MSLILDALKKLDREKSTRRDGPVSIAADILVPDLPRPTKKRIRLYVVTVFLTAVAATVITYALVVHFGLLSKSSSSPPVNPQAAGGQQVASAPPSREPVDDGRRKMDTLSPTAGAPAETRKTAGTQNPAERRRRVPPAAPSSGRSARDNRHKMSAVSPGIGTAAEVKKAAEIQSPAKNREVAPAPVAREPVREDQGGQGREIPRIERRAEIKKPAEGESPGDSKNSVAPPGEKKATQPVVTEKRVSPPRSAENTAERAPGFSPSASSSLKISGIVWHEEPSRRIAVINGMITNEGSVVGGVKVLEIFPDRVRFSQEGQRFEIPFR